MKRFFILLSLILSGCYQNSSMSLNVEYNENCINMRTFKIFQVIGSNYALANECNNIDRLCAFNPVVLLTPMRGFDFYDDMIFTIPSNKCAVQKGTYQYETKDERYKTVPRITYEYEYSASSEEEFSRRFYEKMDDIRYECKLSLTENKKYNTQANIKKCDCSVDYLIEFISSLKEGNNSKEYNDIKKQMEKKCGRVPNGYLD